ncbi:MAG: hypothetical protein HY920_07955 [Elusimicrobia bacterium]|nr:hypothetical protein [Elusimicrobiota bacterium]
MKKILVLGMAVWAVFLLAGYLAAETAVESTNTKVLTTDPDKALENVEKEAPVAKAGDTEEFEVKKDNTKITSTVSGNIDLDKEKLPRFKSETIPQKGFKAEARITAMADSKSDKMMLSSGDLVRINIGAKKNVREGSFFSIYKTGKSIAERGKLDESGIGIAKEEKMAKSEVPVVTKVADAKVIKVESNYSIIRILRCLEPVMSGDYAKLNRD